MFRVLVASAFIPAVYVGHHGRSGALMALTEHGAVKARRFKKVPESDRFHASELEKLRDYLGICSVPWRSHWSLGRMPRDSNSACTYRYATTSTKNPREKNVRDQC